MTEWTHNYQEIWPTTQSSYIRRPNRNEKPPKTRSRNKEKRPAGNLPLSQTKQMKRKRMRYTVQLPPPNTRYWTL